MRGTTTSKTNTTSVKKSPARRSKQEINLVEYGDSAFINSLDDEFIQNFRLSSERGEREGLNILTPDDIGRKMLLRQT